MNETNNKREFTRVPIAIEVEATAGNATIISSQTKDLSMKGMYVVCDNPFPLGTQCHVVLFLGSRNSSPSVEVGGRIARIDDAGMGIEFTKIMGLESFDHLRNLVLHNAPETTEVEQELKEHLGLKRRE